MSIRLALPIALAALAGCAPEPSFASERVDERTIRADARPLAPHDECLVYTAREPATSAAHVAVCASLEYPLHPPAGGMHFSQWAAFGVYDEPIPSGFLVHSLEHGAIVLSYRCDEDCDALRTSLEELIAEHGPDPLCRGEDFPARFVLVPDPELEWPIAATAWEHVYLATCFDRESLRQFIAAHYGQAPEDLCVAGVDRSAAGWCP